MISLRGRRVPEGAAGDSVRPRRVATSHSTCALANKLARICYASMRDQQLLDGATVQCAPTLLRWCFQRHSKKLIDTNVTPSNAATKSIRCPMLWGCPQPNAGRTENASKTCVKAMTPKQPTPVACSAETRPRSVRKRAAATARKTQAAACGSAVRFG